MNTEIVPPDAPEANLGAAVDFLATIAGGGRIAVTAIAPDRGPQSGGIFDTSAQRDNLRTWLEQWTGRAGVYYTINEPRPDVSPDKIKLQETDIAVIRGVAVDLDPDRGEEVTPGGFERERQRLLAIASDWSRSCLMAPTAIVDSGGGVQMVWLFEEPLPNTDDRRATVKAQAKALERLVGSDAVSNLDRLLRVPFTVNLPDSRKLARGRKRAPTRLEYMAPAERTSLAKLKMAAAPIVEQQAVPAIDMTGFDYDAVLEVAKDPCKLPPHLRAVVNQMRQTSPGLAAALANPNQSERDFAVGCQVVEFGITDPTELAQTTFSVSPETLLSEESGERRNAVRGEWYAAHTITKILRKARPKPRPEDWFSASVDDVSAWPVHGLRIIRGLVDAKAIPIRRHLIDPRLPIGDVTQGVGEPGVSKSTFGIRDALVVATGREDLLRGVDNHGEPIAMERLHRSGPVLVYNAEDRIDEMEGRLAAAERYYGIIDADKKHDIILWSGVDSETLKIMTRDGERGPLRRAPGADILERVIKKCGAVLVILDPQISLAAGAIENSNEDQDAIMQALATMASKLSISVEVFHHTGKAGRDKAGDMGAGRGGFAAVAKVRSAFTLTYVTGTGPGEESWGANKKDRWVRLDYSKLSHSKIPPDPIVYQRVDASVGNGTGAAPSDAGNLFYSSPLEQRNAEGSSAPVLKVVDIKARAAVAAGQINARIAASAQKIARIADATLAEVDEILLAEVWEGIRDRMRDEGLTKAAARNIIVPAVTAALSGGVAFEKSGQFVRVEACRRGGGATAPWMLRRVTAHSAEALQ